MSRKIFKNAGPSPDSAPFQFQAGYGTGEVNALDADAELDAFQDNTTGKRRDPAPHQGDVNMEELIERARQDADNIVSRARSEAASIEEKAYQKGIEEGRKTGELVAEQQVQAILAHYHQSISALDQARGLALDQMQLDLLDLVLTTTEKLVGAELRANPHAILSMVKDAVQTLKQRRNLTIFLNAEDHRFVMSVAETERQTWLGTQVQLEVDPELGRGSFRIEAAGGELDAVIETRLARLREEMAKALEAL